MTKASINGMHFKVAVLILASSAASAFSCRGPDESSGSPASGSPASSSGAGQGGSGGGGGSEGGSAGGPENDAFPSSTAPRGAEATAELCANGIDDDGNGYGDCDDSWCRQTVELTVCDSLENTIAKCSDKVDNTESPRIPGQTYKDGLVDCADPDCAKNPALTVCPPRAFELGEAACSNGADDDSDGLQDCDDLDCLHAGASSCPLGGKKRVLFDDAHRQRAGSSNWVIDMPGRHPWPTIPKGEAEWAGQLSAFGKDLVDKGYVVETLTASTGRMTFKKAESAQDLSGYDVVIVPEPSAPFDADESAALFDYINAGGGVLMIADHFESDRDGNGWDSVQVWNDFFSHAGGGAVDKSPFGFSVKEVTYADSGAIQALNDGWTEVVGDAAHPVMSGPNAQVTRVGMHRGGLFTLYPAQNPSVTVLLHALPMGTPNYETGSPYVIAASVGAGRVVAIGDSAIMNDGTTSHGASDIFFDSYHDATEQNAALLRNAIDWLSE